MMGADMTTGAIETRRMGRKKGEQETTLMRANRDFVELVKRASGERNMTVAEFCHRFLLPCAEKAHRDWLHAELKRMEDGD